MMRLLLLTAIGICISLTQLQAQSNVFDPADPIVPYNPSSPPTSTPGSIQKWVVTEIFSWDGDFFKSYHFNGVSFRVMFPKSYQHNVADGKKYPVMLFFHGAGETGTIYENELQIGHGGELFMNRVKQNQFDGFLLFPQNQTGSFTSPIFQITIKMLDSLAKYCKLDVDRVVVEGLSAGGYACFDMIAGWPTRVASAAPSAAIALPLISQIPNFVHIPIWVASGEKDPSPDTNSVKTFLNAFLGAGGNMRWSRYPNKGHAIWYEHWNEPGFVSYMNDAHKANPLIYFQHDGFCPGSPITARLGITAGFSQYEWSKDDTTTTIPGATSNEYFPTSFGTYYVRFKRTATSNWSKWSPKPAVIREMPTTITPDPQVVGLRSKVLPAPDGSTTVPLRLPTGFASYEWFRVSDNALVDSDSLYAAPIGQYKARVSVPFECSSVFSNVFIVVDANGPNKPDPATNVTAFPLSSTSIQLNWSDNPAPPFDETNFEIYRAVTQSGPYVLTGLTGPNTYIFIDQNLEINKTYYYIIRAVNNSGAAPLSSQVKVTTIADNKPPTAPGNLRLVGATRYAAYLQWDASIDNQTVDRYDVYVNGIKLYSTDKTLFVVNGLDSFQTHNIFVKARDASGNVSPASNQVTVYTKLQGLIYYYYQGNWNNLPDFTSLTIQKAGTTATTDIAPRTVNDQFAFMWQGYIKIPTTATYTFETCSNDGSKLYLNQHYSPGATANINNDGVHSYQCVTTTMALTANSVIPITATFFDQTGSEQMELYWSNNAGLSRQQIPASAFAESGSSSGPIPSIPSNLVATSAGYDRINLTWTDNSSDESVFELTRSTSQSGPFVNVATIAANTTSYLDTSLTASTTYYYKLRAVGSGGESAYTGSGGGVTIEANWKLNNNFNDALGNAGRRLYNDGTSFNGNDKQEGTHSISFPSSRLTYLIPISSVGVGFPSDGGYSQRTVGLWIKPISTNNKQIVFDFGGVEDGLALRINANALEAGVASGNIRASITAAFTNPNLWTHVAVVYKDNTLKLYINGSLVSSNTSLSFTSIASSSSSYSIFGSSDHNVFNDATATYAFYGGLMDNIYIVNGDLSASEIASLMNNTYQPASGLAFATTTALPAVPQVPSGLTAAALSSTAINLSWNDNSSNESSFEIYRSAGDELHYRLLAKVNGGSGATKGYIDQQLFANGRYYYRVRALGIGGPSNYSNTANALTADPQGTETIIVNATYRNPAPVPWNNMTTPSMLNLKNTLGQTTSVGVTAVNNLYIYFQEIGAQTGNNSGVYPDVVMKDFLYWGFGLGNNNNDTSELRFSGLNPTKLYDITLFPSSIYQTYPTSTVTFKNGSQSVTINAQNNISNKAVISQVSPDQSGIISIQMTGDPDLNKGGFLNAFEISTASAGGNPVPAKPTNLTGEFVPETGVILNWTDVAYNESSYKIFQSTDINGPYILLNPGANNSNTITYTDATALQSIAYYYYIMASNATGDSAPSDTITVYGNSNPVFNNVDNIFVQTNSQAVESFSVTDSPADIVTVTSLNLPSFVVLQDLGGGNYQLTANPTMDHRGRYEITIIAKDNRGGESSKNIAVHIGDKNTRSFYINLGVTAAASPYNDFLGVLSNGSSTADLKDEAGNSSTINISSLSAWTGTYLNGHMTGNNSGIVSDLALSTGVYVSDNAVRTIRFSGLNSAKRYNVVFIGSANDGFPALATYTATGVPAASLNSRNNTDQSAQLNSLAPDGTNSITVSLQKQASSPYMYLNAIVLEEFTDTFTLMNPINLFAESGWKTSVNLKWSDRTNNEIGYELWRATSSGGPYSLITTTVANATTVLDNSANPNTKYYYQVRAKLDASTFSEYSNVAVTITPKTITYVNLTLSFPGPFPWNNLNVNPNNPVEIPNLITDQNVNSGNNISITRIFNSQFDAGMQTFGSGGIFPNNVMRSNYWVDRFQVGQFKISGLNQSKRYRFGFFGSTDPTAWYNGNFTSTYTVGSRTVYLNANRNDSKVVFIGDVMPDANGEVFLNMSTTAAADFGFTAAILIQCYDDAVGGTVLNVPNREITHRNVDNISSDVNTTARLNVYPNPFADGLTIGFHSTLPGNEAVVEIVDLTGRLVYRKNIGRVAAGNNTMRLNVQHNAFSPGVYIMRLNINGQWVSSAKVVKARK